MSEPRPEIVSLEESMVMAEQKKPIQPKVIAGGAGSSLAGMFMGIITWIIEEGFGINLPAPVVTATVGLTTAGAGFALSYYTRDA